MKKPCDNRVERAFEIATQEFTSKAYPLTDGWCGASLDGRRTQISPGQLVIVHSMTWDHSSGMEQFVCSKEGSGIVIQIQPGKVVGFSQWNEAVGRAHRKLAQESVNLDYLFRTLDDAYQEYYKNGSVGEVRQAEILDDIMEAWDAWLA